MPYFFAIAGNIILNLFNISVDSLRVAGGLLLFSIAFDMMHAKISKGRITEEEISHSQEREDIWIFPISLPLLTGPGTISTVIVLMGGTEAVMQKNNNSCINHNDIPYLLLHLPILKGDS
nr:MarC family protein [Methanosarcina barkeri]